MPDAAPKRLVRRRSHGSTEVLTVRAAEVYLAETVEQLGHDLRHEIEAAGPGKRFVLDLSGVTFLSSITIGLILNVHDHLEGRGYPFVVVAGAGEVADVFVRSHLGAALPVFATVEDALRGFQCL
jgi:anti-anti-sigma factor